MNSELLCAICQSPLAPDEARCECPSCAAPYHEECWRENGGCAVYGCPQVPATENRETLEIPASYWGRDHKPCPGCGQEILAAALRCRHCGVQFQDSRPRDGDEYRTWQATEQRLPGARKFVIGLFVACLLPCTALPAAVVGLFWIPRHKAELRALPPLFSVLARLGVTVGFVQSLAALLAASLYSALHHSP